MNTDKDTAALVKTSPGNMTQGWRFLPTTLSEAREMASILAASDLVPKAYRQKPMDCLVAYEYGSALGLSWMQSLRSVSVINGQGALWGDAVPALILGSKDCTRFHEEFKGKPFDDDFTAVCTMGRRGLPDEIVRTFSVADAKRAKLWGKTGREGGDTPWVTYPQRMLQMRARGFAARDAFPDKLSGLILAEEAMDYPDAIPVTEFTSEAVTSPLDGVEAELRGGIEKGFELCKLSAGQRTAKINEYLGGEKSPSELASSAVKLHEWLKDEYSRLKTGKSRDPKAGDNAKRANAPGGSSGEGQSKASDAGVSGPAADVVTAPAGDVRPGVATVSVGNAAPVVVQGSAKSEPLTADQIPFGGKAKSPLPPGEIFSAMF